MNITEHFTLAEMTHSAAAERMGLANLPNKTHQRNLLLLCETLEIIRGRTGGPLIVTSGFRHFDVNRAVGGSPTSAHCVGYAADFHRPGWELNTLWRFVRSLGEQGTISYDQLIGYDAHVHLSVDPRHRMMAW